MARYKKLAARDKMWSEDEYSHKDISPIYPDIGIDLDLLYLNS